MRTKNRFVPGCPGSVGWSLPNTLVAQQSRQWAADDAAAIATAKAGAKPREAADAIANATLIFCGPPVSVGELKVAYCHMSN